MKQEGIVREEVKADKRYKFTRIYKNDLLMASIVDPVSAKRYEDQLRKEHYYE